MAVRSIRLFGDPGLRVPAAPVTSFDKDLRRLVGDLTDTLLDAGGVGLAAPQLGVGLRVFVYHVEGVRGHLVNPSLELSGERDDDLEGCLSFPGVYVPTPRARDTIASGSNLHGDPLAVRGTRALARCLQHEADHLDGVLFIDRMDREQRKLAMRAIREADWSGQPRPRLRPSPHPTGGPGR